jgi:hypothetical protein
LCQPNRQFLNSSQYQPSPNQTWIDSEVLKDSLTPKKWGHNVVLCTQS